MKLQDAINLIDTFYGPLEDHWVVVLEAARKYANPDYEAAIRVAYYDDGLTAEESIRAAVDAALGITEDK